MSLPALKIKVRTFADTALPPNVFPVPDICKLIGVLPYYDPTGTEKKCYEDYHWESIEARSLGTACRKLHYDFDWESWTITKDCPTCKGSGFIETPMDDDAYDYDDCATCKGSGKVEVEREDVQATSEYEQAADEVAIEHYNNWKSALEQTLSKVFGWVHLNVTECRIRHTYQRDGKNHHWHEDAYHVYPDHTWMQPALDLIELINGVGYYCSIPRRRCAKASRLPATRPPCSNTCTG